MEVGVNENIMSLESRRWNGMRSRHKRICSWNFGRRNILDIPGSAGGWNWQTAPGTIFQNLMQPVSGLQKKEGILSRLTDR